LKKYLKELNVPYFFESQNIIEEAKKCDASSSIFISNSIVCSWCSRMKRGILYNTARREGYNVLAMGQHLDDLSESLIMSIFHNGYIRTMKAHYVIDEGDLRVIRPLVYVRERETKKFCQEVFKFFKKVQITDN
jgi:tRNA 2-thiocytidine biosynthesis protein TtcA